MPQVPPEPLILADQSGNVDMAACTKELASGNAMRRRLALVQLQGLATLANSQLQTWMDSQSSPSSVGMKVGLGWLAMMPELNASNRLTDALHETDALVRCHALAALTAVHEQQHRPLSMEEMKSVRSLLADQEPMVAVAAAELLACGRS